MDVKTIGGRTLAVALSVALSQAWAPAAQAASHLVDPSEMTERLVDQARSRQEKVELFQKALAAPEVKERAEAMGVDAEKLAQTIPHLSDQELADLAERATRAQDVAAGHRRHHYGPDAALVILGIGLLVAGIVILALVLEDDYYYDDYYWDDCCW
jgi:hypothetical protein